MSDEIKNLFVSHVHEDDAILSDLKSLLSNKGYDIRDASINSTKPNNAENESYIKYEILAPRINWAGALVVLISPNTHTSDWVNWEIEYAYKQGKRIIGVWTQGAQDSNIPSNLHLYANAVIGWQGDRIIDAINGNINNWSNPDGSPREPRLIERYNC